jgi:anti-anti-sigma regulatory factor
VGSVLPPRPVIVDIDVSCITEPDEYTLDALARLHLTARRLGASIRLLGARPELVDLIQLAGLADVLEVVVESGVEVGRQVEECEEVRVDEEVQRGDASL